MYKGRHLNKIIDLLERDEVAFGRVVMNGSFEELMFWAESNFDFVIIEMEHEGFNFTNLRQSLAQLMNRKRITENGLLADPTPIAWVAPDAREIAVNQWVVQQTLDQGPYGVIVPGITTPEEAQAAVAAARYPQRPGSNDTSPEGMRGWWRRYAPRYWGLTPQEYFDVADLWPLDPDGELILIGIIEDEAGVKNIRDILKQAKGIGAIWMEHFDMALSMGVRMGQEDPRVEEGLMKVLTACKDFGVPCAVGSADPKEVEMRLNQGFKIIMNGVFKPDMSVLETGWRVAGRKSSPYPSRKRRSYRKK